MFIGLSTAAYIYWDVIEPGQWFIRNTGKVWMTVSCKIWTLKDKMPKVPAECDKMMVKYTIDNVVDEVLEYVDCIEKDVEWVANKAEKSSF